MPFTVGAVANMKLPFCPELLISRDQYLAMRADPSDDGQEEPELVTVHPDGPGAEPMQVPKSVLVAGQRFVGHLAYDLYRIQKPVDRLFYDTFVGNACCPVAQSKALEMYNKWRRFMQVKHMLSSAEGPGDAREQQRKRTAALDGLRVATH